jgi:diguanylate cyclase (GGDEF)-like protein
MPLAIALCDLDYFKAINDTYGHLAGDAVLVHVAEVLRQHARSADVIGRYGGEEFLILLPNTDAESALRAAARLREALVLHPAPMPDDAQLEVTGSLGVAALSELPPEAGPDALLALADRRLYEAKAAGRNRVVPDQVVP